MKRLLCITIAFAILLWEVEPCQGQWGHRIKADSGCNTCEKPHPAVARLEVSGTFFDKRTRRWRQSKYLGTAVLLYKDGKKAVVGTVHHLFRNVKKPVTILLKFSNGETFRGVLSHEDKAADLAAIVIDAPSVEPIPFYLDDYGRTGVPKIGERTTVAGYGQDGCYKTTAGVVRSYRPTPDGKNHWIEITGGSRMGDSGGPMLNSDGELIGILNSTDGTVSIGAYNGHICQFLKNTQFILPWNANLEAEKERSRQRVVPTQPQAIQPQVFPNPSIDSIARQMAQDALSRVSELERSANEASSIANEAVTTAKEAAVTASKVADEVSNVEESVLGKAKEASKSLVFGLLKSWGVGGGLLATGVAGIVFFFIRNKLMVFAQVIDKLTDKTPWKWDDKLVDPIVYKAAAFASGKPIPEYANTPGLDPWGRPLAGQQQPAPSPPQQPVAPAQPVPVDPVAEVQNLKEQIAELRGRVSQPTTKPV